jgi:N-dimethylarginine dimethylaminohydrolase
MKVLMVDPYNFDVKYSINPWMNTEIKVDKKSAIAQWENLKNYIITLGVEVVVMDSSPLQPDIVFAANAGKLIGNKFILSNFKDKERKEEKALFRNWFSASNYKPVSISENLTWEGEACTIEIKETLLCSYGYRSDRDSYNEICKLWKTKNTKYVYLSDPYFYHLDVCFCKLNNDTAIYCPLAFTAKDREWLEKNIKNLIPVSLDDALNFGCNAFVVENKVLISDQISESLVEMIQSLNFQVIKFEVSEYIKAGGGVKCLICTLD